MRKDGGVEVDAIEIVDVVRYGEEIGEEAGEEEGEREEGEECLEAILAREENEATICL